MPVNDAQGAAFPAIRATGAIRVPPYARAMATLAATALIILWLGEFTEVDLWLADWFYDSRLQAFPWRHNWIADVFIHRWLKQGVVTVGLLLVAVTLVDAVKSLPRVSALLRVRLRIVSWSALLIPGAISLLKRHSMLACPWDLQRYGGDLPYLRLLDSVPEGLAPGHCFPAGFASTGLWLAACAVFWLPGNPGRARRMFLSGLAIGILLGWVQQARGAHFLTHTLWSTWIASALLLALYALHAPRLNRLHQYASIP